jgi:hypothetical protein
MATAVQQKIAFPKSLRPSGGRARGGFQGLKPIKVKLFSVTLSVNSSPSASLSLAGSIALTTGNFPELANFMVVYDQLRILKIRMHHKSFLDTLPTSGSFFPFHACAVSSDPTVGAPGSIGAVLEETFSSGVMGFPVMISNATSSPMVQCEKVHTVTAHFPPLAPIISSDCPGSAWIVLDSATAPTACVVQAYINALGTSGVSTFQYIVELDVELRIRT